MREKVLKNKLILISLLVVLFVSCGGSGGGNSNLPINPGNNISPIPKKSEVGDKTNLINPDVSKPINPTNTVSPNLPKLTTPKNKVKGKTLEELRAKISEIQVKEFILKEKSSSTENTPIDVRVLNGNKVKVGVLDGDFINRKTFIKSKFGNVEIIDRNPRPKNSDHRELVLKAMREGNQLGIIAGSIREDYNKIPGTRVIPKFDTYEKVLAEFDPSQRVKVFSQSCGVPEEIGSYIAKNENDKMRALSSGELDEGIKIFNFYKEQVNKDSLFI